MGVDVLNLGEILLLPGNKTGALYHGQERGHFMSFCLDIKGGTEEMR
jgi:hypothetical protein